MSSLCSGYDLLSYKTLLSYTSPKQPWVLYTDHWADEYILMIIDVRTMVLALGEKLQVSIAHMIFPGVLTQLSTDVGFPGPCLKGITQDECWMDATETVYSRVTYLVKMRQHPPGLSRLWNNLNIPMQCHVFLINIICIHQANCPISNYVLPNRDYKTQQSRDQHRTMCSVQDWHFHRPMAVS